MCDLPEVYKKYNLYEASDIIDLPFSQLFSESDELLIELTTSEKFYGKFLQGGRNRIDVINVKHLDTGNKLSGTYSFYRNEIARIRYNENSSAVQNTEPIQECTKIKLDNHEYLRLKEMTKQYVFIKEMCLLTPLYVSTIEKLKHVEQIGVAAPGILRRDSQIPLLILATWNEVFIFDTTTLATNCFCPNLKDIFESEQVCKIIHKSGPLMDTLTKHYHIVPKNIFDTEVVDLIIHKSENPDKQIVSFRNISQCLQTYLKFPPILDRACNVKSAKWSKRPLKTSKMQYASELAAYLIVLKETLDEILLSDLNKTVDNFCDYYGDIKCSYKYSEKFSIKKLSCDLQDLIVHSS